MGGRGGSDRLCRGEDRHAVTTTALRRLRAEADLRSGMADCRMALSPDDFTCLKEQVKALPPLTREQAAQRLNESAEARAIARIEDHAVVYHAIFSGVHTRSLRRAMFPSAWCRDRDAAMLRVSKAIRSLRAILERNTADPGLLLLSFEGVIHEFRNFLRLAWSDSPPDPTVFDGRGSGLRELLAGSPERLGWSKGGRPKATWQRWTRTTLRENGVRGEALEGLIWAAGLREKKPVLSRLAASPSKVRARRSRKGR